MNNPVDARTRSWVRRLASLALLLLVTVSVYLPAGADEINENGTPEEDLAPGIKLRIESCSYDPPRQVLSQGDDDDSAGDDDDATSDDDDATSDDDDSAGDDDDSAGDDDDAAGDDDDSAGDDDDSAGDDDDSAHGDDDDSAGS